MATEVLNNQVDTKQFMHDAENLGVQLADLNFQFLDKTRVTVDNSQNLTEIQREESESRWNIHISYQEIKIPRIIERPVIGRDITSMSDQIIYHPPRAIICSSFNYDEHNFEMVRQFDPNKQIHSVDLALRFRLSNQEISLDNFPFQPNRLAVKFDFKANPNDRKILQEFKTRRMDPHTLQSGDAMGEFVEAETRANLRLGFQDPKRESYLKCFEVEMFSNGHKDDLLVPFMSKESQWQPEQHHYCLIASETGYPLIPFELERLSNLLLTASFDGKRDNPITTLFEGLRLRSSKVNQWYAGLETPTDTKTVLFNSKWRGQNAAVVYKKEQSEPFYGLGIKSLVDSMIEIEALLRKRQ